MILRPASIALRRSPDAVGVDDGGADLHEGLDGLLQLAVEDDPVGDHDDRAERVGAVVLGLGELVGQPGDRVRLAAAGGVLDQVAAAGTVCFDVGEQPPYDVELVVAGEDLASRTSCRCSGSSSMTIWA